MLEYVKTLFLIYQYPPQQRNPFSTFNLYWSEFKMISPLMRVLIYQKLKVKIDKKCFFYFTEKNEYMRIIYAINNGNYMRPLETALYLKCLQT